MAVGADGRVVAEEVFGTDATPRPRDRAAAEAATRYAPGSPRSFERKIYRSVPRGNPGPPGSPGGKLGESIR
jgi:hypothetical protein